MMMMILRCKSTSTSHDTIIDQAMYSQTGKPIDGATVHINKQFTIHSQRYGHMITSTNDWPRKVVVHVQPCVNYRQAPFGDNGGHVQETLYYFVYALLGLIDKVMCFLDWLNRWRHRTCKQMIVYNSFIAIWSHDHVDQ